MVYPVAFLKQHGGRVYNDEYIRGEGRSWSQGTVEDGGSRLLQPRTSREYRIATADLLSPPLFACVTRPTRLAALHVERFVWSTPWVL
jgi:hypothetical protein